jgi:hypothetical protein
LLTEVCAPAPTYWLTGRVFVLIISSGTSPSPLTCDLQTTKAKSRSSRQRPDPRHIYRHRPWFILRAPGESHQTRATLLRAILVSQGLSHPSSLTTLSHQIITQVKARETESTRYCTAPLLVGVGAYALQVKRQLLCHTTMAYWCGHHLKRVRKRTQPSQTSPPSTDKCLISFPVAIRCRAISERVMFPPPRQPLRGLGYLDRPVKPSGRNRKCWMMRRLSRVTFASSKALLLSTASASRTGRCLSFSAFDMCKTFIPDDVRGR